MPDLERQGRMLGALLRIPFEAINLHVNTALRAAGFADIRPAHQTVFQQLPPEGARVTDLAERAQMTKQSMSALVDYLEEHGYMTRVPDPHDKRASIICRTERGWMVEQVARASIKQLETDWSNHLGEHELHQLRALLTKLGTILEEE